MNLGKFSIVMATLNSMRTLESALKALREQNYPVDLVEILVVDGGSTDGTRELAAKYGCRVVDNPKVEPVSAKLLGLAEARGTYLMHVDSDEVMLSRDALKIRDEIFRTNPQIKMIFSSGYVSPAGAPFAARYINEFGDPFSMFYYRFSKDARFLPQAAHRRLHLVREFAHYTEFTLQEGQPVIFENAACGNSIDVKFFRDNFPELCTRPDGPVHFFYHMQSHSRVFAITKDDAVEHHSTDHWSGFLGKIKWRVRNNIFSVGGISDSGFLGRARFDSGFARIKKYFYLPYAFLILPAAADALYLVWTRRDPYYLLHLPLTIYTAFWIVAYSLLKKSGYRPARKAYGDTKTITGAGPRAQIE